MNLPPFDIFPQILGDRILLREVLPSDFMDILEISFYDSIQAKSAEEVALFQEKINQNYLDGESVHWGIAEKSTNRILGTLGYYRGLEKGAGELGCVLLPQFRGQGFMMEAMQMAIAFGQNSMGLNRIFAITTKQNNKAINLLGRLGFVQIEDLQGDKIEFELKKILSIPSIATLQDEF